MPATVRVTPRRPGDPTVDLLELRVAHAVMLRDLRRLAALAAAIAAGRQVSDERRARAVARYVGKVMDSVHEHHSAEDEVLWPVIAASAGDSVDLAELSDDHSVLDPRMDRIRAAAAALAADPRSEDAATSLAVGLADLRDLLKEHIADEEQTVFPVMTEYVSVADWAAVTRQVRRRAGDVTFMLPRAVDSAAPEDLAALKRAAGPALLLLLALVRPRHRRFERLVFADLHDPGA
jgi:hemerythrin-like domain-containing protein